MKAHIYIVSIILKIENIFHKPKYIAHKSKTYICESVKIKRDFEDGSEVITARRGTVCHRW